MGLVFLLFTSITFNFPTLNPVTSENMNYTSAAVGVIMCIAVLTWVVTGRMRFRGPESGGVVIEGGIFGGDGEQSAVEAWSSRDEELKTKKQETDMGTENNM